MAPYDFYGRRKYVKTLVDSGVPIPTKQRRAIAGMFGCSVSAVTEDISIFRIAQSQIFIYALCDPDTEEIRYVGQTACNPDRRIHAHIRLCARGIEKNAAKSAWINSLLVNRKNPSIAILEQCDPKDANEREQWWIKFHADLGAKLTNVIRKKSLGK